MKKFVTALIATTIALSAFAEIKEGNGYYRVQNYLTKRYLYITDNRGSINFEATTAELGALQFWKGLDKAISDPATVVYAIQLNGNDYDVLSQGTGVQSIIDHPVSIRVITDVATSETAHRVYGRSSGAARYIADGTNDAAGILKDRGYAVSQLPPKNEATFWVFRKLSADSENYFGLSPEVKSSSDYYTPFYAAFPFSLASQGMKAYYVSQVGNGQAALREITGTVPAGTPVIIKSAASTPAGNKLNIGGTASAAVNGNHLAGIYFDNAEAGKHYNRTPYDRTTMRVLGTLADGTPGFVTADIDFLPRNKAYLTVPAGSPAEIRLVDEKDFDASLDDVIAGRTAVRIEGRTVYIDGADHAEIFTITGRTVASGRFSSYTLPSAGLYIVRAGGTVVKVVAK